jgi:hypothetical protein
MSRMAGRAGLASDGGSLAAGVSVDMRRWRVPGLIPGGCQGRQVDMPLADVTGCFRQGNRGAATNKGAGCERRRA